MSDISTSHRQVASGSRRESMHGRWVRQGSDLCLDLGLPTPGGGGIEQEAGQPTLRQGSRGSAVTDLQRRLTASRFSPGPLDGAFGGQTAAAVRAFQQARGLTPDGIVGPLTWAALYARPSTRPPRTQPPSTQPRPPTGPPSGYGGRRDVRVVVPFSGYQSNDKAGCFRRCTEMAALVGVQVGGPDLRIQIALREDLHGRISIDPSMARTGIAYIDQRLDAGDPVVVGVSYTDAAYNVDDITDHFVIITTRGTGADSRTYYAFHDPASSHPEIGGDRAVGNRFFLQPGGGLIRPAASSASAAPMWTQIYDVSMVRRNL